MLDLLVAEAKERGVRAISLGATDMGKPLYEKYGFVKMKDEMKLPSGGQEYVWFNRFSIKT